MALIQVNYLSKALFRTVPLQVILPVDRISFETLDYTAKENQKFKTLYLLHGLLGNYTDWVSGTRIQRWAEEKNLAVVMPSGDNAFYADKQAPFSRYGEFIGEELVDITRKMFPLSDKREDTFIAGLSMGGYGAVRNGLVYSETFSHIAGLSSALDITERNRTMTGEPGIFEDGASLTDKNPAVAMQNLLDENRQKPRIYLACGLSDGLLETSRKYRDLFRENGFDITYEEEPGAHEWDFWDRQIHKVLQWLPLEESDGGLSSGKVRTDTKEKR